MLISIVIDSDTGHCYEHLKKNQFTIKIELVTCIWMFVYAMIFELPEMEKMKFWTFQAQPVWVRVISSNILYVNVVLEKFQW